MDDLPSYSTTPEHAPFHRVVSSTQHLNARQLAAQASLLDLYTVAALTTRHGSLYRQTNQRIEALAQKLSAQSLKQDDVLQDNSPSPTLKQSASYQSTPSQLTTVSSYTLANEDGCDFSRDYDEVMNSQEPPELDAVIEPDEPSNFIMQVDEGYGEGVDDSTWTNWQTLAEVGPYVGCRMSSLLRFRTSADAALQCSRLVHKSPRMRKRKHVSTDPTHSMPASFREQHSYHSVKRIRQA